MKKEEIYNMPVLCFPNHFSQTSKLSSTARIVLDAAIIVMDDENNICFDDQTINILRQLLGQNDKPFTVPTIKNAISELFKAELLLRQKNNHYVVNPQYYLKFDIGIQRRKKIEFLFNHGYYDRTEDLRLSPAL